MQETNSKGQFIKGMTPWNKGRRGYMGANKTSFTPETVKRAKYYMPRTYGKRQEITATLKNEFVPVKDSRTGKIYRHHKRTNYARAVLIQAGHNIPAGCVVWHIDKNPKNNTLENLEIITRAELAKRNQRGIK